MTRHFRHEEAGAVAARFQLYAVTPRHVTSGGPVPAGVMWRLLSLNNRDLGRAGRVYASVEECLAAVTHLRESLALADPVVLRDTMGRWTWRICVDADDLAVSSRSYQRRVQTEYAVTVFLGLVPDATVMEFVRGG